MQVHPNTATTMRNLPSFEGHLLQGKNLNGKLMYVYLIIDSCKYTPILAAVKCMPKYSLILQQQGNYDKLWIAQALS